MQTDQIRKGEAKSIKHLDDLSDSERSMLADSIYDETKAALDDSVKQATKLVDQANRPDFDLDEVEFLGGRREHIGRPGPGGGG